jgi:hypothetical protein
VSNEELECETVSQLAGEKDEEAEQEEEKEQEERGGQEWGRARIRIRARLSLEPFFREGLHRSLDII